MSESNPPPPSKKRCTIYVDAFNWYFGIFQHHPAWKWLNVQSFFEALRLDEEVVAVKFFTALVDPLQHVSTRRDMTLPDCICRLVGIQGIVDAKRGLVNCSARLTHSDAWRKSHE